MGRAESKETSDMLKQKVYVKISQAVIRLIVSLKGPGSSVVEHVLGKDEVGGSIPLLGLLAYT